jgi:hypothetical protein
MGLIGQELSELPEGIESVELAEVKNALMRSHKKLLETKKRGVEYVNALHQGAYDAMVVLGKVQPVPAPKTDNRKVKAEVALWHTTDWQGAKKTTTYDTEVMAKRVMQFAETAVHLTNIQRTHHPVNEVVICFGGDMVEGLFNFPSQVFEVSETLFEQFVTVSRLLVDLVRYALANYTKVTVIPEWGNHGRIGSKRDAVPRSDNFDRMCYELARQLLAGEKRLTWNDCPEDIQRIEIGNYKALLIHGDEIGRNGSASSATIVQHANRWRSGAYDWEFRDVYVGHYHTHNEWSMANGTGAVFQTGSTESDNRYASVGLASSAKPSQRLHFIDPIKGRVTSQHKIYLD